MFKDSSIVKEDGYCRYYPRFPENVGCDAESGYAFCEPGQGAFAVYSVDIDDLAQAVKKFVYLKLSNT